MPEIVHFDDWLQGQPRGTKTRIFREFGVSFTVLAQATRREPLNSYKLAKTLSEATGGVVTVRALCEPEARDDAS